MSRPPHRRLLLVLAVGAGGALGTGAPPAPTARTSSKRRCGGRLMGVLLGAGSLGERSAGSILPAGP